MSRTYRSHKGKKIRQTNERKKNDKKFFGHTSGQHSRGVVEITWEDEKIVYTESDRAPIKGKDFIKYGWPFETRNKKMIQRMKNI